MRVTLCFRAQHPPSRVSNELVPFTSGGDALSYLPTTEDPREMQRCYDLGANIYVTKPIEYELFADAIRQLGLFFAVMQVPETN